jgi:diamine N-acetyltransferase
MSQICLRQVDRTNWRETLELSVHPDQQRFVAGYAPIAAIGLAKAYVRPGGLDWMPYAIYADTTMVGFLELAYAPGSHGRCWIYHFFIDRRWQGRGYAKQALQHSIELVAAAYPDCRSIGLTVHPENQRAQRLYQGAGFEPTSAEVDGEPVYVLALSGWRASA